MLIDAQSISRDTVIETDICIVGAGAAGITLAKEFAGTNTRISLLESGALELEKETQSLYEGDSIGMASRLWALDRSRLRYFGGTTNHWGGYCRPLDDIDFEARSWIPHSGWPFNKAMLDPFYRRAHEICEVGAYQYDIERIRLEAGDPSASILDIRTDKISTEIFRFSPPTRFKEAYLQELQQADNVDTYIHANALEILTGDNGQHVERLRVSSLGKNYFWISAKHFVLALGGIENPRLLLLSKRFHAHGLGNQHDLVGRYFMEHPHLHSGIMLPSDPPAPLSVYEIFKDGKTPFLPIVSTTAKLKRDEKLLNLSCEFIETSMEQALHITVRSPGIDSARKLKEAVAERESRGELGRHIKNIVFDLDSIAKHLYARSRNKKNASDSVYMLFNRVEQSPNPESRVTLGSVIDIFGQPRVQLDWQLNDLDKQSIRRSHGVLGRELGRLGFGRFKVTLHEDDDYWTSTLHGGNHHMGTTRMHEDPRQGVVDPDCKVHGISNLFIAGSSVFPTSGFANPTLTIVALAARLADHLKKSAA